MSEKRRKRIYHVVKYDTAVDSKIVGAFETNEVVIAQIERTAAPFEHAFVGGDLQRIHPSLFGRHRRRHQIQSVRLELLLRAEKHPLCN
jgi:hypothetical protein